MPRLFSFLLLDRFKQDMYAANAARRALMQSARAVLKVDPIDALGVFPIHVDQTSGWMQYVLVFPEARGRLIYEVDEIERIIVLREVLWR